MNTINNIKIGDILWFSCDSSELNLEDYNCRISSGATIIDILSPNDVYLIFDSIDGDEKVGVVLSEKLIKKYGKFYKEV